MSQNQQSSGEEKRKDLRYLAIKVVFLMQVLTQSRLAGKWLHDDLNLKSLKTNQILSSSRNQLFYR